VPASLIEGARWAEPGKQPALAYYESLRRAFSRASHDAGGFEQRLEIADVGIHLRFAGQGLPPILLPAFLPVLAPMGGRQDIEVELWDETTTGVGIPEPPWRLRDVIARGDVRSLSGGRVRAQVDTENQILTMWDSGRRRAIVWFADAHRLPYWVGATPLRSILHWGLAGRERHLLHAAAIGDERSGALLVGPGGSGKSTTSLACLQDGLGYVGDDYILAETGPSPRAVSVYGTAKLSAASAKLLSGLPGLQRAADAPKFVVDVARDRPKLMRRSAAISAIILPRVTPGRLALRPAGAADALRALAPSTILQHADESARGMAVMSALARHVPAYVLDLGSDVAAVAPAIRGLLEST
jgi:hypothetical protein